MVDTGTGIDVDRSEIANREEESCQGVTDLLVSAPCVLVL